MQWYNNPDAVAAVHDHMVREATSARRRGLRHVPREQ